MYNMETSSSGGSQNASLRKWNVTQDLKDGDEGSSRQRKQYFSVPGMQVPPLLELLFPPCCLLTIFSWNFIVLATNPDPSYPHNNNSEDIILSNLHTRTYLILPVTILR